MIKKKISIDIELTPSELAEHWCRMDNTQQAEFFNNVRRFSDLGGGFCFLLQDIVESKCLTDGGREVMKQIGEYADED